MPNDAPPTLKLIHGDAPKERIAHLRSAPSLDSQSWRAAMDQLEARLGRLEAKVPVWVFSAERLPTVPGMYVVMSTQILGPAALYFTGAHDRQWERVTQWLGPLPDPIEPAAADR